MTNKTIGFIGGGCIAFIFLEGWQRAHSRAARAVSRHLSQLKAAGILADEKRGSQVFYRLRVPCVLNFFRCVEAVQHNGKEKKRPAAVANGRRLSGLAGCNGKERLCN